MEDMKKTAAALDVLNTRPQRADIEEDEESLKKEASDTWERFCNWVHSEG